jgi:hypothetical protein
MSKVSHKTAPSRTVKPTLQSQHSDKHSNPLAADLIQLIDEVAEFADLSAFINHALTTSLSRPELLNPHIASGARICSALSQNQSAALQGNLAAMHARYIATRNPETLL